MVISTLFYGALREKFQKAHGIFMLEKLRTILNVLCFGHYGSCSMNYAL